MEWKSSAQVLVVASADPNLRRNCEAGRPNAGFYSVCFGFLSWPEFVPVCPEPRNWGACGRTFLRRIKPGL